MAQQPSPSPGVDTNYALNLASLAIATMFPRGRRATADSPHPALETVSQNFLNQPAAPGMMPLPSSTTTPMFSNHEAQQTATKTAQAEVAARHSTHPSQQDGSHGELEVEVPRANEQPHAKVPEEAEISNGDAGIAGPEDEVISDSELSDEDTSDGIESHMSLESEDGPERLDKYAFNYSGQAYDHQVPQNLTGGIVLFTSKVTQGTTILHVIESADKQNENIVCPTLIPHALEMKRAPKKVECIWVGMIINPQSSQKHTDSASVQPNSHADATSTAAQDGVDDSGEVQFDGTYKKKVQKKTKKGRPLVDLVDEDLEITPHDPNALRVVAKKQTKAVKTWHLYALTMSDNNSKICQGWKVPFEEVYFFRAFRDDTVAGFMKRRHASDLKIKAVIFPAEPTPAVLPESSSPVKRPASNVSAPTTPPPGGLPSPQSSGRKEKRRGTVRNATPEQATEAEDVRDQNGGHVGSPVGNDKDGNGSDAANQPTATTEPKDLSTPSMEPDKSKLTADVFNDGDEDSYPEYSVSATDADFKSFLDGMMRQVTAVESTSMKPGVKRKRVAFEPVREEIANSRRKTGDGFRSNEDDARDGEGGVSTSFVAQQDTDHLFTKLMGKVNKLVAKQDVAGLRQCITLVECIEKRGCPGQTSALAPYLSITSKKDATASACSGKLREILVSPLSAFLSGNG